jgi:2-succinyl-6-hydroxy-2,4-cyclohexadiene-1-carboxylate synthase
MGGRLAMHALLESPELWSAAILVSANPGLPAADHPGRAQRMASDESWARRFESDPWEQV